MGKVLYVSYLCELLVVTHTFKVSDEPFPATRPVGGHSTACIARARGEEKYLIQNAPEEENHQPEPANSGLPQNKEHSNSPFQVSSNHQPEPANSGSPRKKEPTQSPSEAIQSQQLEPAESVPQGGQEALELTFQDPEEQWEMYMGQFNATEVDRLVIEELAKVNRSTISK